MKRTDIIKYRKANYDFFIDCFLNDMEWRGYTEFKKMYKKASSIDNLKEMVVNTEDAKLKMSQAYSVISKELDGHWMRIRKMLGDKVEKTDSDAGGLKIGNESFSVIIPNGYGDGTTRFAVVNKKEFNTDMLRYFTGVSGDIDIYSYDCGNEVIKSISGKFSIYQGQGFVVFVKY